MMSVMRHTIGCLSLGAALFASALAGANDSPQINQGAELYKEFCAKCHGEDGRGGQGYPNPIWGEGAQIRKFKTAQALFEYNRLLMPFDDPARLSDEQKLAVTAFLLANHGVLPRTGALEGASAAGLAISK